MTAMKVEQKVICFINITHKIVKEEDCFVATCLELGVSSQGDTIEEADDNLKEAVLCYLETIDDLGIRDEIFNEKKIVLYKSSETANNISIKVPINPNAFITASSIPIFC